MSDAIRVFIAIEIPAEIQDRLSRATDKLKIPQDKIAWTPARNIHITLKFLGDVPEKEINKIKDIVLDTTEVHSAFEISIEGLGAFPSERRPRVIWAGVEDKSEIIKHIFEAMEEGLAEIGFPKEERSFVPHLTLGRVKYVKDIKKFAENISKCKEECYGNVKVDSISLIKSTLTQKGSIYETIYRARLKDSTE